MCRDDRWAGTARDGLVTLTRREDDKICSHDLGSAIIILVMSTRWEVASRWAAMPSQMGMDDDKGTEDRWASMTRRMVTDAVEQVGHTDYFRNNLNSGILKTKPPLNLFQHASWR